MVIVLFPQTAPTVMLSWVGDELEGSLVGSGEEHSNVDMQEMIIEVFLVKLVPISKLKNDQN